MENIQCENIFPESDQNAMPRQLRNQRQYILESIIILLFRIGKECFLLVGISEGYDQNMEYEPRLGG